MARANASSARRVSSTKRASSSGRAANSSRVSSGSRGSAVQLPLLRRVHTFLGWEICILVATIGVLSFNTVGYIFAGLALIVMVLTLIPFGHRTILDNILLRRAFKRRAKNKQEDVDQPIDLVPLGQWVPELSVSLTKAAHGQEVGVISDGTSWVSVLGLINDDTILSDQGERIDLDALSGLTVQDDILFAGLQLVTYTVPAPNQAMFPKASKALDSYLEIVGQHTPPSVRRTWICVRLDPRLCLEAVARRGATNDAIFATLRFGVHRVQAALKRQGIETDALNPMELYEVLSLTSGSTPERSAIRSAETWDHWECDGLFHVGQAVADFGENHSLGYQALLSALANANAVFACTSYTIDHTGRARGAVRIANYDEASAKQTIQRTTSALPQLKFKSGAGVQVPAMLATVPLGKQVKV